MSSRDEVLKTLVCLINSIHLSHPVRVGIDGVDCSGKTTISNELSSILAKNGKEIIRVSIDGFHNPKEIRYRLGATSPKGYYEDSFNYQAIITNVLSPLGPEGNLRYSNSIFDFRTDSAKIGVRKTAFPNAILLFDGIFLHRPELINHWDFTVFIDVEFEETLRRAKLRDQGLMGSAEDVETRYLERYIPGQKIYLRLVKPDCKADVVLKNTVPDNPTLIINNTRD